MLEDSVEQGAKILNKLEAPLAENMATSPDAEVCEFISRYKSYLETKDHFNMTSPIESKSPEFASIKLCVPPSVITDKIEPSK